MKLTQKNSWGYKKFNPLINIDKYIKKNQWVGVVKSLIPNKHKYKYLELGCAPGLCTAAISKNTEWIISGIDFSDDAEIFLKTLSTINKDATLIIGDVFEEKLTDKYDIVASYGFIEHFSLSSLDSVINLHDLYLKDNGYLVIEVPNFTGVHFYWHYLFDKPNLKIHNLETMSPTFLASQFNSESYQIIFNDYVGNFNVWGNSSFENKIIKTFVSLMALFLNKLSSVISLFGFNLSGRLFSPTILFIARKNAS